MPMYPCHRLTEGGGGEALVETVLWTNPSPSSNFSAQTVTLSQSMSDFDMLRFEIRTHVSSPTTTESIYAPLSYFGSTSSGSNAYKLVLGVYQFTNLFARETYKSSDTQIYISEARRLNASGTSTDQIIPYKIYGVKKSSSGSFNVKMIEPTVVVGDNTIETGVTIKQLVIVWQNPTGSHPNYYHVGEWNYLRPDKALRAWITTSSSIMETSLPYSTSTAIKSVGTTSFVYNVNQSDINNIGGNPRCYIYY